MRLWFWSCYLMNWVFWAGYAWKGGLALFGSWENVWKERTSEFPSVNGIRGLIDGLHGREFIRLYVFDCWGSEHKENDLNLIVCIFVEMMWRREKTVYICVSFLWHVYACISFPLDRCMYFKLEEIYGYKFHFSFSLLLKSIYSVRANELSVNY